MAVLPMFPLGSVLFPTAVLPLHVFEPRYRELVDVCLAGDREFGVVLIERGFEVGGDDVRTDVGTVAQIVEAQAFDDGRWALLTVGVRRLRVRRWLDDDPYPRAEVDDWPEPAPSRPLDAEHAELRRRLRRALALATEVGRAAAPATTEISDDPVTGGLQAAHLAPLGPADKQALLAAATPDDRTAALLAALDEQIELLEALVGWS